MSLSGGLMSLLNDTVPATTKPASSTTTVKRSGPQTIKVASQAQKLPHWQTQLASAFLMTPDMTKDPIVNEVPDDPAESLTTVPEDRTQCICGSSNESEVMIQCSSCKNWLHVDCVRLQDTNENDPFICLYCQYQLSRSIKRFVRSKLSALVPLIHQLQAMQSPRSPTLYDQMSTLISETQEVLDLIPGYLPPPDKPASQ